MSELTCACPHCGQELNVGSEFAGQAVACPSCGGEFEVPEAHHPTPILPGGPPHAHAPKLVLPGSAPPQYAQPPQYQQPYQAPTANLGGPQSYGYGIGGVSPGAIELFAQTRPWVQFLAILGFIAPTIMFGAGLIILLGGAAAGAMGLGILGGAFYMAIGAIYFLPAWRLWQYSSAISYLRVSPTPQALEATIDRQRSFWKTVGIMTLLGIALGLGMMLLEPSATTASPSG